jgi:hypothetical protein
MSSMSTKERVQLPVPTETGTMSIASYDSSHKRYIGIPISYSVYIPNKTDLTYQHPNADLNTRGIKSV